MYVIEQIFCIIFASCCLRSRHSSVLLICVKMYVIPHTEHSQYMAASISSWRWGCCNAAAMYHQTPRWEDYFIIQCQSCSTLMCVCVAPIVPALLYKRTADLQDVGIICPGLQLVDVHWANIILSWSVCVPCVYFRMCVTVLRLVCRVIMVGSCPWCVCVCVALPGYECQTNSASYYTARLCERKKA